jgi:hypothetical protein
MKRIFLTAMAVLLVVPAIAQGKSGIEFSSDPATQKAGDAQQFKVILFKEPADPMSGAPSPISGVSPLVTFRNETTGRVIRVRSHETNSEGLADGRVVFPDEGPWVTTMSVGGHQLRGSESPPFTVGTRVSGAATVTPAAHGAPSDGGAPPYWLLALPAAALAAAALWLVRHRRPRELGA